MAQRALGFKYEQEPRDTGMNRKARRQFARRWRKSRCRTFPSPSAIFRYLAAFHDPKQETQRVSGKAFIPAPNKHLRGFMNMTKDFLSFLQQNRPLSTVV